MTFLLLDVINVEDILELLRNTWDSEYDRDYTDIDDQGERLTRGGVEYHRLYGWKRFAMEVIEGLPGFIFLGFIFYRGLIYLLRIYWDLLGVSVFQRTLILALAPRARSHPHYTFTLTLKNSVGFFSKCMGIY
jgi:hypothetical protein